jgi:hypothetical protein
MFINVAIRICFHRFLSQQNLVNMHIFKPIFNVHFILFSHVALYLVH